ncbi:MAG TPA: amidohydrolase family protein [Terriglobales bacterium]|nr:amidohydrolase family protein [Candidatus Binataceae bacterium]HZR67140.1 amidohydrolase family protein [Terriglobales bacterium]
MNRRDWLHGVGLAVGASAGSKAAFGVSSADSEANSKATGKGKPLALADYEPKSMLHTEETHVPRAAFPVVDVHTHITVSAKEKNGVSLSAKRTYLGQPDELLAVMDRKNIRAMVNLTGGYDEGLVDAISKYDNAHPGRFYCLTEPCYEKFLDPTYPQIQADEIERAHRAGAKGLKILKTLGLYLRENITSGKLVKIDDPRFDPMWDACGQLNMPVAIHISDPVAFFTPTDRFNERYEELNNHPDWSFYDHDFPSNAELIEARNRMIARHPKTQFLVLHVGNFSENLDNVSENLDRFPNMTVDIAARIGELGRQPRRSRKFFDKYQDRILFGTDATPHGDEFPQQVFNDKLYEIYYRFLETEDEYFDYAPAPKPPQGRWQIYGIGLPKAILEKVYNQNFSRLFEIKI